MTADRFDELDKHTTVTVARIGYDDGMSVLCICGVELLENPEYTYEITMAELQKLHMAHLRAVLHDS